jgi:hypothetical protein
MTSLRTTGAAVLTAATLVLAGCAQAEDAVRGAAEGVASSAASQAAEAAKKLAREQLCKISSDGKISPSESRSLDAAVAAAESAGVPREITDAARQLADEGTAAPRQAVADLQEQCAAA